MSEATQTVEHQLEPGEQARVDVYRLLGLLLLSPPDDTMLELLCAIQPDTTAEDKAMTEAWQALQSMAVATEPEQLKDEYFKLFIGLGRGELVPYASYYIHGLLMEKILSSLRDDMARLGIERQANVVEPEDHAGAICEMMAIIISSSELNSEQLVFFETYVTPWLGRFFDELCEAESAHFYQSVGHLGQAFLVVEQRYFTLSK
jgi:TorA maturation chaperone TorD